MLTSRRQQWFIITKIELQKIWANHLISLTVAAFTALLLIKRGNTWETFSSNALIFLVSVVGLVGFAVISSWVFAREYTDGTFKDLLALPISRSRLFFGKLVAIEIATFIITALASLITLTLGVILFRTSVTTLNVLAWLSKVWHGFGQNLILAYLWPLVAVKTKNTILPAALAFITLIIGIIFASQPLGQFIPWAIPGYTMANSGVPLISHFIILLIGYIGIYGTLFVWKHQDQA